ncbi:hypothetical protein BCR44DRAFT_46461 [Catenaria anguillulae PL171]|uniref:Uncharacterized protein n=1 Tax=Catenaria anguillulae PL171 TaxID=765915 RepID=A0A1Y2I4A5_9FUNG|nr:hypothetical protein BCR44DRAFT_46461 [Catenaria anguillulae PL171]
MVARHGSGAVVLVVWRRCRLRPSSATVTNSFAGDVVPTWVGVRVVEKGSGAMDTTPSCLAPLLPHHLSNGMAATMVGVTMSSHARAAKASQDLEKDGILVLRGGLAPTMLWCLLDAIGGMRPAVEEEQANAIGQIKLPGVRLRADNKGKGDRERKSMRGDPTSGRQSRRRKSRKVERGTRRSGQGGVAMTLDSMKMQPRYYEVMGWVWRESNKRVVDSV